MAILYVWLVVFTDEHVLIKEFAVWIHAIEYCDCLRIRLMVFVQRESIQIGCFADMRTESLQVHIACHVVHIVEFVGAIFVSSVAVFDVRTSNACEVIDHQDLLVVSSEELLTWNVLVDVAVCWVERLEETAMLFEFA